MTELGAGTQRSQPSLASASPSPIPFALGGMAAHVLLPAVDPEQQLPPGLARKDHPGGPRDCRLQLRPQRLSAAPRIRSAAFGPWDRPPLPRRPELALEAITPLSPFQPRKAASTPHSPISTKISGQFRFSRSKNACRLNDASRKPESGEMSHVRMKILRVRAPPYDAKRGINATGRRAPKEKRHPIKGDYSPPFRLCGGLLFTPFLENGSRTISQVSTQVSRWQPV
jgi:hypothetical protein